MNYVSNLEASEDIESILDPVPWASLLVSSRNLTDPITQKIKNKILGEVNAGEWKRMTQEERRLVLIDNGFEEFLRFNAGKDYADLTPVIKFALTKESNTIFQENVAEIYKKLQE